MSKYLTAIFTLVILIFSASLCLAEGPVPNLPTEKGLSVSAEAEIKIVPDKVELKVHIDSPSSTKDRSLDELDKLSARVIALALKYNFSSSEDTLHLAHSLRSVKTSSNDFREARTILLESTKNLNSVPELVNELSEIDNVKVTNIEFGTLEPDQKRKEGFLQAYAKAKAQADYEAHEAGMKLGRVSKLADSFSIEKTSQSYPLKVRFIQGVSRVYMTFELLDP